MMYFYNSDYLFEWGGKLWRTRKEWAPEQCHFHDKAKRPSRINNGHPCERIVDPKGIKVFYNDGAEHMIVDWIKSSRKIQMEYGEWTTANNLMSYPYRARLEPNYSRIYVSTTRFSVDRDGQAPWVEEGEVGLLTYCPSHRKEYIFDALGGRSKRVYVEDKEKFLKPWTPPKERKLFRWDPRYVVKTAG